MTGIEPTHRQTHFILNTQFQATVPHISAFYLFELKVS